MFHLNKIIEAIHRSPFYLFSSQTKREREKSFLCSTEGEIIVFLICSASTTNDMRPKWVSLVFFFFVAFIVLISLALWERIVYQWRSPTHTGGGPRPPQNFKKLIYSMYIIYILKNIACKIEVGPPKFWVISMILLKEREIILKSYNLRGLTN